MSMYKKITFVILVLGIAGSALADTDWTNNGGDRQWDNASNWSAGVPTTADKAGIRASISEGPIIDAGTSAVSGSCVVGDWGYFGIIDITGGTFAPSSWFFLGYGAGDTGTFNVSGGTTNCNQSLKVGYGGTGQINMTGGVINVDYGVLAIAEQTGGSGDIDLYGGTISCLSFTMGDGATMDITEGTLMVSGNVTSDINTYIGNGWIVAYAGSGNVLMDYNISNPGKTTVTAQTGEKAGYPDPANGATGVSINADLSWTSGIYATSQDVYFGTDSTPDAGEFQGNQTETTFPLPELALDTTYYWRIDGVDVGDPCSPWVGDVWSFTTQSSTATLKKGPYLIYPGLNTQMQVLWQLDYSETCSIEWGLDTNYSDGSSGVSEYGTDHQYKYTITGLTPGSKYYYRVTVGTGFAAGSFIAAPAASATSIKFLMFGDCRSHPDQMAQVNAGMNSVISSDPAYQTIGLLAGDWVEVDNENNWTDEYFNRSYTESMDFQATVAVNGARGNHEGGATVYKKYMPFPYVNSCYFSFDYGPVHVAVVDQYVDYSPASAQYSWLVNDLNTSIKPFKIIALHQPGWSAGNHANDTNVQNYLQPLCTQYGVQIILGGHNHYYSRAVVDGIHHLTSGGYGAGLVDVDIEYPYIVSALKTLNFQTAEVSGNTMTVTSYKPDLTVIDTFQVTGSTQTVCGDDTCEGNENQCNCPEDCGSPPSTETSCTDSVDNDCDNYMDCDDSDCDQDPACQCGNGTCDPGEDCTTCSEDCISRTAPPKLAYCCGDGTCEGAENETNCAVDCGGGAVCGDETCDPGEDQCNCPQDCGTPPSTETSCTDEVDNDCDTDVDCDDADCLGDPACPTCGDETCDSGEDQCNCPADCGTPPSTETGYCTDGINNDCDADTDCDDSDCVDDPACSCGVKGDPCTTDEDCCKTCNTGLNQCK